MINLDEIERRANAATPGPWTVARHLEDAPATQIKTDDGYVASCDWECDAAFIAHARTDVPALIAEVRRLRGEIDLPPVDPESERVVDDLLAKAHEGATARKLGDVTALVARVRELEAECERMRTFAAENFSAMLRQEAEQMREYGLSYEGVRKVLREHDDGEISFGKLMDLLRAAARAMAEDMKHE